MLGLGSSAASRPAPAIFSLAAGMRLWFDSDWSGGVNNGDTPLPVNRIAGSNAVGAKTPGGTVIYESQGWQGPRIQSAWKADNGTVRFTGSDIGDVANGTGKNWYYAVACLPNYQGSSSANSQCVVAGWDLTSAPSFNKSSGLVAGNNTRCTLGVYPFTGSSLTQFDPALIHQAAMFVEVQRIGGNQIQIGVNGVWGAPQAYEAGVPATVDGFSINGWFGNAVGNGVGYQRIRGGVVVDHPPSVSELADIRGYLVGPRGIWTAFEHYASLGAVAAQTNVDATAGQSNNVGVTPDGVLTPYSGLSLVSKLGEDGIIKPYVEPLYDFARSSTWPIDHSNPDSNPGQSAYGAMAAQVRALGNNVPRIYVPGSKGSSSVSDWLIGVADVVPSYQNLLGALKHQTMVAMQAPNSKLAPLWWNDGEQDAQLGPVNAAAYEGRCRTLFDAWLQWAADMGYTFEKLLLRFVVAGLPLNSTLADANIVRAGQQNLAATRPDTIYVQQPNIGGVGIHLYAPQQITQGTSYGTALIAAP